MRSISAETAAVWNMKLYDLVTDPLQLKNMLHGSPNAEIRKMGRLHNALTQKLVDAGDLPTSFPWPTAPASPAPLGKPSAAPGRPW